MGLARCQSPSSLGAPSGFCTIIGKSTPYPLSSYSFSIFLGNAEPSRTRGGVLARARAADVQSLTSAGAAAVTIVEDVRDAV